VFSGVDNCAGNKQFIRMSSCSWMVSNSRVVKNLNMIAINRSRKYGPFQQYKSSNKN